MSYDTYKNSLDRSIIYLAEIQLISCSNVFGQSPCTATGDKCYNTSTTCKDKANFTKATNTVKFCSSDVLNIPDGYRPYIKSVSFVTSELREDKTVPQLINLTLCDDTDSDIDSDPYWSERGQIDAPGSYFKKLFARNANIKGRTITLKQGFEGLAVSDYQTVAVCKISEFNDNNGTVSIKADDILKGLEEYKYPFRIPGVNVGLDVAASFIVDGESGMLSLDAIKGDRCRRRDFESLYITNQESFTDASGQLIPGDYWYKIYTYDVNDLLIGYDIINRPVVGAENAVQIKFMPTNPAAYKYRIYGRAQNSITYYAADVIGWQDEVTFIDKGESNRFPLSSDYPQYKEFILQSDNPKDVNSWQQTASAETINLNSPSGLSASGFIKIEKEIIYYSSYVLINGDAVLQNVQRGLFETEALRHYAGAAVYTILYFTPDNPFTIAKSILTKGGVSSFADTTTINALESAWTGPDFSCLPIIKDSDLAKLYFDLMGMLNCRSWVNEAGKITIKEIKTETPTHTISDDINIIKGSGKLDGNNKEIKTRVVLFWDRTDATKGSGDKESYLRQTAAIDADAESENEYGEELKKELFTYWINSNCGEETALNTYVNALLEKKVKRLRDPKSLYTCDVELKDSDIKLGEIVYVDSDDTNNADGDNLYGYYEIVKREPKGNKITLTAQYFADVPRTITIIEPPLINVKPIITTRQTMPDEIETTNLQYFNGSSFVGGNNLTGKLNKTDVTLRWDNGYTRTNSTIKDMSGNTISLIDTSSHKIIIGYNIYLFTANDDATTKKSATQRPSNSDANGVWVKLATIPDRHINDNTYKYQFIVRGLKVGKYYDFFVSEVMKESIYVVDKEAI